MSWSGDLTRAQDNYTAFLVKLGGRFSIWRRPPDEGSDTQQGDHQRIANDVPGTVTATPVRRLLQPSPFAATYAQSDREGTTQPRQIELAYRWNGQVVDVQQGDVILGPDGTQYRVNDAAFDETLPLSFILNTDIIEAELELVP